MQLMKAAFIPVRDCEFPYRGMLGDGSIKEITKVASMNLALKTIHGPVLLQEVELLVGRPEMSRLNLPDLESALAALAAEQHGKTDDMSSEQERGINVG